MLWHPWTFGVLWLACAAICDAAIPRLQIVSNFTLKRNHGDSDVPYTVGNGNFAFNADITGLQTIKPFNTLSSWGWHSTAPPPKDSVQSTRVASRDQEGLQEGDGSTTQPNLLLKDCWWLHEKAWKPSPDKINIPNIEQPPPAPKESEKISYDQWQRRNPHRMNLGRVGLLWNGLEIQPSQINETEQSLNLTMGVMTSNFYIDDNSVEVETTVSPLIDAVGIRIQSDGLVEGNLSLFLDFPYPRSDQKFEAPFMGDYSVPSYHKTSLQKWSTRGEIKHEVDNTTYYVNVQWDTGNPESTVFRDSADRHRYVFNTSQSIQALYVVHYSPYSPAFTPRFDRIKSDSIWFWKEYWSSGAFVDCTSTKDPNAQELQRRIILSQYHLAVNAAGVDPPPESGLVNNGWYGKFHLEMVWWHLTHWARWGKWERIGTMIPTMYNRFLQSSKMQTQDQGYEGVKWGSMDNSNEAHSRSETNAHLIWQQPHPFYFAELEYRAFPTYQTLQKWHRILEETAKFMVSFPKFDPSTKTYNLEPPIRTVNENTPAGETRNPTFELAYWRFGLNIMANWYTRQGLDVPKNITKIYDNLALFPNYNNTYLDFEGSKNMWLDRTLSSAHPTLAGIFGMLPPDPRLNMTLFQNTMAMIYGGWNMTSGYGWDFPLLSMTAVRMGDPRRAVDLLLHPSFQFDEVGLPVGGTRVPTPYFPSSGGLLMAVAMLANGWRELHGRHWPHGWTCEAEGFNPGL